VSVTLASILVGGCGIFVSDVISGGLLGYLGLKPSDGSILLKFLFETRLQSKSFKTLDDVQDFRFKSDDLK